MSLAIGNLFLFRLQSALTQTQNLFRYTRYWRPQLSSGCWLPNNHPTTTTTTCSTSTSNALIANNIQGPFATTLWDILSNSSIWHIKRTFQPSLLRRKRKMGWLARKRHRHGRAILRRRKAKGRWRLCGGI